MLRSHLRDYQRIGSKGKLSLWPLVMTIFFCVSGGPYGLETVVQSGHGMALILIVVIGIIWAMPIALLSAELGSAIPEEGGYYEWVKRGIGPRTGFACAWLTYLYSCVDVAIYPVLFTKYLGALGFDLSDPVLNATVRLGMVIPLTWLNVRGAVTTGRAALLFAMALLIPFVVMIGMGIVPAFENIDSVFHSLTPVGVPTSVAFTTGLFVIMWNYLGWDSISTISREMKDAPKIFPKALTIGLPLVILCYLLPVVVGIGAVPDISQWTDGSWPSIARAIGGNWLAVAIGVGGIISSCGLFAAGLLAASRIPFVLAEDGYMPRAFTKLHKTYETPVRAIIISATIYMILSSFSFEQLAEVDVLLYSSALVLEFFALMRLRQTQPELKRPFRIPGGMAVVSIISILPILLIGAATVEMLKNALLETILLFVFAAITGVVLIYYRKRTIREQTS